MVQKIKVFIAGDSTAAAKSTNRKPETGWGERIKEFLSDEVEFLNLEINGRGSKSFVEDEMLQKIAALIKAGDYLFNSIWA